MASSLVILAAGVGSRYGGLKQLDGVGPSGETLMEYSIFDAIRAGFERVVFVVRPETEQMFRDTVGQRVADAIEVAYVHQTLDRVPEGCAPPEHRTKPWGTGQAVLVAEGAVDGPFAVINADDFYGRESFRNLAKFLSSSRNDQPPVYAIQGFEIGPTLSTAGSVSRGLCRVDGDGWLESIVEILEVWKQGDGGRFVDGDGVERRLRGDEPVSMNMWGFTPAVFDELRTGFGSFLVDSSGDQKTEFLLPAAVQGLIRSGDARVKVLRESGPWCGMTYPEDRARAAATIGHLIADGIYPESLWR